MTRSWTLWIVALWAAALGLARGAEVEVLMGSTYPFWAAASLADAASTVVLFKGEGCTTGCSVMEGLLKKASALTAPLGRRLRVGIVDCANETSICYRCGIVARLTFRRDVGSGSCSGAKNIVHKPGTNLGSVLNMLVHVMRGGGGVEPLTKVIGDGKEGSHPAWHKEMNAKPASFQRIALVLVVPDAKYVLGGYHAVRYLLTTALSKLVAEIIATRYHDFGIYVHAGVADDVLAPLIESKHGTALAGLSSLHHQLLSNLPFAFERDDATDTAVGPMLSRPTLALAVRSKAHGELRRYDGPFTLEKIFGFLNGVLTRRLHRKVAVERTADDIELDDRFARLMPPDMLENRFVLRPKHTRVAFDSINATDPRRAAFDAIADLAREGASYDFSGMYVDFTMQAGDAADRLTRRLTIKVAFGAAIVMLIAAGTLVQRHRWKTRMRDAAVALSRGDAAFGVRDSKRGSLLLPSELGLLEGEWDAMRGRVGKSPRSPRPSSPATRAPRSSRLSTARRQARAASATVSEAMHRTPASRSVAPTSSGDGTSTGVSGVGTVDSASSRRRAGSIGKRPLAAALSINVNSRMIAAAVLSPQSPSHAYLPTVGPNRTLLYTSVDDGATTDATSPTERERASLFRPVFLAEPSPPRELRRVTPLSPAVDGAARRSGSAAGSH